MNIFCLPSTGASNTVKWEDICHTREPFIVITYDNYRATSRWTSVERKNKFEVILYARGLVGLAVRQRSFHRTLELAQKTAQRWANELTWDADKRRLIFS